MTEFRSNPGPGEKPPVQTLPVSVVVPVRNEEKTIGKLIEGLENQSYRPSEIVITDGGSKDSTCEVISRKQKESQIKIVLIETDHAYPGKGRNLAIGRSEHSWLACIDAGTVPRKDWLEHLVQTAALHPKADFVFGKYLPVTDSLFTHCAAITYVGKPAGQVESIASCLIKKTAWKSIGDFREDLRSGEDLLFFHEIDDRGLVKVFAEKAIVDWEIQPTFGKTYTRFKTYSRNGMKAGLFRDWQFGVLRFYAVMSTLLILSWFWPFLIFLPILIMILRTERRILRWYHLEGPFEKIKQVLNPVKVFMVCAINVTIDIAMVHGLLLWLFNDWTLVKADNEPGP